MRRRVVALLFVVLLAVGMGIVPSSGVAEPPARPVLQLPAPSLTATALSQTSIQLDWTYGSLGQTGFILERSTGGGPWGLIHTAGPTDRSYTDPGLSCGTTYDYRIAATSTLGNSPWGPASATTLACSGPTSPPSGTPAPPAPPPPPPPRGAEIQLHAAIGAAGVPPQQLWTGVQQREGGQWQDVDGWQGTLDEIVDSTGLKSWWAGEELLGAGPFRWVVYEREGGRALAQSAQFYVPDENWETEVVRVVVPTAQVGSIPFTGLARPIVYIGVVGMVLAVVALGIAGVRRRLSKRNQPT